MDNSSDLPYFNYLYLPIELKVSKKETLILPKLEYSNIDIFKTNILGKDKIIKLTEIIEQHEGWLRVAFSEALQ